MRWADTLKGNRGAQAGGADELLQKGKLPYGGFPAAKKMSRLG